jgi:ribosomal protein S18 acetylase RimI-like enzyme
MHTVLEDFSATSIINAMEMNIHEAWIRFAHLLGAIVHDEYDLLWFLSGFPMAWLIGPSTRPVDLGSRLEAYGWMLEDEAPGMAIDLETLAGSLSSPASLTIERVQDEETLRTWLRIMTVSSDIPEEGLSLLLELVSKHGFRSGPSVHFYLGILDDKPVATSMLYLGGGVAGIYNVATLPGARRQRIGGALTTAPLLQARALGYRTGTLQSTPMGLNLYHRLGFREYCTFRAYFWQGEE